MKIVEDKFNSDIFGIKMGNVIDIDLCCTREDVHRLIKKANSARYMHLNAKVNSKNKISTNAFLAKGFELVDTQLMYSINTKNHIANESGRDKLIFREYQKQDRAQIINIAKSAYVIDQYHSDSKLDNTLCDVYYSKWLENCCDGLAADKVMVVVFPNNEVAGYITFNYQAETAVVGLVAVDERFRGRGIFTFLIDSTLRMLFEEKIKLLFYGTQLSNTPVLKTMGHFSGFIEYSNHVMHLML